MSMHGPISRACSITVALGAIICLAALSAQAECMLQGQCLAEPNPDDPSLGAWKYCATVTWDTGSPHALSHLDVVLLLGDCPCICEEFSFGAQDTAGTSTGSDGAGVSCTVPYLAEFLCHGDPSIDLEEPLVKFEPFLGTLCEPEATGSGVFCFYSDWPPVPVVLPNQALATKAGQEICMGQLTGVLPECTCGGTPTGMDSWGHIKTLFR